MRRFVAGALGLLVATAAGVAAQTVEAGPLTLDFTGRAQLQLNTTSIGDDELGAAAAPAGVAFETRRIRFGTEFAYEEWITGTIEVDFGGAGATLTDGFVDLALADWLAVTAGQFKKPFGLFELASNTRILTVERKARLRGLEAYVGVPGEAHYLLEENRYLGRDIGVMAHGTVGRVGYAAAIQNGSGPNAAEERGSKAYAGRLAVTATDGLVLGAGVSRQPTSLAGPDGDELIGTAWAVDAELGGFRQPGLRLMAEAMGGDDAVLASAGAMPSMIGAQAAAGWFAPRTGRVEGIEPVLRVSWADPDTDLESNEGLLLTPGVNVYFTGRNRLMLNGEVYVPAGDLEAQYGLVAQLQVHF